MLVMQTLGEFSARLTNRRRNLMMAEVRALTKRPDKEETLVPSFHRLSH